MSPAPVIKKDLIEKREEWRKHPDYGCYWSSPDNEKGLQLTPTIEPGRLFVEMTIEKHHSGFPGIAHGGIAYTILDGLMGWYIMSHEGRAGMTTHSSARYKGPLIVGKRYRFEVTQKVSDQTGPGTTSLIGRVFEATTSDSQKWLVEMTADFFLPNRALAQKILGIELGVGEEFFPVE